jgi:hypothetical protein
MSMGVSEFQVHLAWLLSTAMTAAITHRQDGRVDEIAFDVAEYIAGKYAGEDLETIAAALEKLPIYLLNKLTQEKKEVKKN